MGNTTKEVKLKPYRLDYRKTHHEKFGHSFINKREKQFLASPVQFSFLS